MAIPTSKGVSISAIDALDYTKTLDALIRTIETLESKMWISTVYWFSDAEQPITSDMRFIYKKNFKIKWVKIPRFKKYTDEYNYITLKLMPHICIEDYNFIIHSDGFAVNSDAWTNEFFEYDYIGAGWHSGEVGNGGFTMRSRKLYEALLDIDPPHAIRSDDSRLYVIDGCGDKVVPEDNIICKIYKQELESRGIRFAPTELADQFSIEHRMHSPWLGKSLGFHGKHGIATHYGVEL